MSARIFEVWRDYGSGPTVEEDYDSEEAAIDDARRWSESDERAKYEVVRMVGDDTYEVVWSSEDFGEPLDKERDE